MPPRDLPPDLLRIDQASAIADVVAKNDEVWGQKSVVLRRGGVVEFEAVGPVPELDVEGERLVEVAEG